MHNVLPKSSTWPLNHRKYWYYLIYCDLSGPLTLPLSPMFIPLITHQSNHPVLSTLDTFENLHWLIHENNSESHIGHSWFLFPSDISEIFAC